MEEIVDDAAPELLEAFFKASPPDRHALSRAIRRRRHEVVVRLIELFPLGTDPQCACRADVLASSLNEALQNYEAGFLRKGEGLQVADNDASIDVELVRRILRLGASPGQGHMSRAICEGNNDLVYVLAQSGAAFCAKTSFERVLELQGARDDNAKPELLAAATQIARTLFAFHNGVPDSVLVLAMAKQQLHITKVLVEEKQRRGLRVALHSLRRHRIPGYLRFQVASFLYNIPEHLRPQPVEEPEVAVTAPTAEEILSPFIRELSSSPNPDQSIEDLVRQLVAVMSRSPPPPAGEIDGALCTLTAAVPDLECRVVGQLYDALSSGTPSLDFLAEAHYANDLGLQKNVGDFLRFLKSQRRRKK